MKATLHMGYSCRLILDVEDAVEVLKRINEAQVYETEYRSGQGELLYIGGKSPDITLKLISDEEYAVGRMRGEKRDENPF